MTTIICLMCSKPIDCKTYQVKTRKYCSRKCKGIDMSRKHGANTPRWKGGKIIDGYGYVKILSIGHPYKDNKGYVAEHRLVMEKKLGRYIDKWEVVHHLDHNKTNNHISNLILTNRKEHLIKYHYSSLIERLPRKLNNWQVKEIKKRLSLGEKSTKIAEDYSISPRAIRYYRTGGKYNVRPN